MLFYKKKGYTFYFDSHSSNSKKYFHCHNTTDMHIVGTICVELNDVEYGRYIHLCNGNKIAKIVRIETDTQFCNLGVATELMKFALEKLKDYNIYLLCHPMPRGNCDKKHRTVNDLKRFYSKFGFENCGELLPTMIRKCVL